MFKLDRYLVLLVIGVVLIPNISIAISLITLSLNKHIEYYDTIAHIKITRGSLYDVKQQDIIIADENNNDITEKELEKTGSFKYSATIKELLKGVPKKTLNFNANIKLSMGMEYLLFIKEGDKTPLFAERAQLFQFDNKLSLNENELWVILPEKSMIMPSSLSVSRLEYQNESESKKFTNFIGYELVNWKSLKRYIIEYSSSLRGNNN